MQYAPKYIGLAQAVGLGVYVGLFAVVAFRTEQWVKAEGFSVHPIAGITLFLLAFLISALISGSIVLAYPAVLFFDGRKLDALKVIFWSAVWLIAIFLIVAVIVLLVALRVIFS